MPVKYVCRNCGHVIYEFNRVGNSIGLLTPMEVAKLHGYVCPYCKSPMKVPQPGSNFREYIQVSVKLPGHFTPIKTPITATALASRH